MATLKHALLYTNKQQCALDLKCVTISSNDADKQSHKMSRMTRRHVEYEKIRHT